MNPEITEETLLAIVAASPAASAEALGALRAARDGSPVAEARYRRAVDLALSDPDATLTFDQRRALAGQAAARERVGRAGPRTRIVRLRLSEEELERMKELADGRPLSAFIRSRLLG